MRYEILDSSGRVVDFANDEKILRKHLRAWKGQKVTVRDRWFYWVKDDRTRGEKAADVIKGILGSLGWLILAACTLLVLFAGFVAIPDCIFGIVGHTVCVG